MRKIFLTLAALAAVGFVVPMTTSAKAEDTKVVIKHRGGHHMDRGRHLGFAHSRHEGYGHAHAKKVVIIKKHGRRHYD
jgi:Ni/Co efflux regulator RcnB